jgi:hypothetical protein
MTSKELMQKPVAVTGGPHAGKRGRVVGRDGNAEEVLVRLGHDSLRWVAVADVAERVEGKENGDEQSN